MTGVVQELIDTYTVWRIKSQDRKASEIKDQMDPISVLATIALIKFKSDDVKLRLKPHAVQVQEKKDYTTSNSNFRGLFRWIQWTSHEDLDVIKICILKAAQWYHPEDEKNVTIRKLFNSVKEGLEALKKTYSDKSQTTVDAIESWKQKIDLLMKKSDQPIDEGDKSLQEKIKDLWVVKEIEFINSYLDVMNDKPKDCQSTKEQLEFLIAGKQDQLRKICEPSLSSS